MMLFGNLEKVIFVKTGPSGGPEGHVQGKGVHSSPFVQGPTSRYPRPGWISCVHGSEGMC